MRQHHSTSAAALMAALVASVLLPSGPWQAVAGGSTAPRPPNLTQPGYRSVVIGATAAGGSTAPRPPNLTQPGYRSVVVGATVVALASLDLPGPPSVPTMPPAPAVVAAPPLPPASPPPSPLGGVWAELRRCESGGDYATDTGNGYFGAYQFSATTWHGLGFTGLPDDAAPAFQDEAAVALQARSGWGQWPACSRRLGL